MPDSPPGHRTPLRGVSGVSGRTLGVCPGVSGVSGLRTKLLKPIPIPPKTQLSGYGPVTLTTF